MNPEFVQLLFSIVPSVIAGTFAGIVSAVGTIAVLKNEILQLRHDMERHERDIGRLEEWIHSLRGALPDK